MGSSRVGVTAEGVVKEIQSYSINNRMMSLNIAIDPQVKRLTNNWKVNKVVVNVVIMNMLACMSKDVRLYYSRGNNSKIKNMYNKRGINGLEIKNAVSYLESIGYLINHIAPRQYGPIEVKMSSWIEPTPFFMSEFITDMELLEKAGSALNAAWMPIILRDADKKPVDYRADEYTFAIEAVLNRMNETNGQYTFTDHEGKEFQNWYCRIFNNSNFMQGGRFYKASVLNINNKENNRLHIKIDGESVVEVDYTALHIFMTAEKLGCAYEFGDDPYKRITDIDRGIVKLAVNTMFNCTSRKQAVMALNDRFRRLGYEIHTGSVVVAAVFKAYPELKDEFCYQQCSGLSLQNKDSWMTHYVANVMSTLGKPFLPVHDSGIVRAQDEALLIELMCNAYKETLKVDSIVHMKRSKMVNGVVDKEDVSC